MAQKKNCQGDNSSKMSFLGSRFTRIKHVNRCGHQLFKKGIANFFQKRSQLALNRRLGCVSVVVFTTPTILLYLFRLKKSVEYGHQTYQEKDDALKYTSN